MSAKGRNDTLTIAVISDIHAFDTLGPDEKVEPSHLCMRTPENIVARHPIAALKELLSSEKILSSLLLCPGDFGDKARPAAIAYAWKAVNEIALRLGANSVLATVGNHDVDSRYNYSDHDPKGFLQGLAPPFPCPDELNNNQFWSRNYTLIEMPTYRLLILNSSAFHGGNLDEINRGRISERTLTAIKQTLQKSNPKPVNILLCHHHPHKHSEIQLGEYDEMLGGQLLLMLLGCGLYGDWLVLHGHKHHPKICYAAGGNASPVVFSAGSLSAKLYPELATVARNQFYLIHFPTDQYPTHGFVGTFDAWDWVSGSGWQRAGQYGSGLPGRGGFGYRGNLSVLAAEAAAFLNQNTMPWSLLVSSLKKLEYLIPSDLEILFNRLRCLHNINVLMSQEGTPEQIGMSK